MTVETLAYITTLFIFVLILCVTIMAAKVHKLSIGTKLLVISKVKSYNLDWYLISICYLCSKNEWYESQFKSNSEEIVQ